MSLLSMLQSRMFIAPYCPDRIWGPRHFLPYPMVIGGSVSIIKATGEWNLSFTSDQCRGQENVIYTFTPSKASWRNDQLVKQRDNLTLILLFPSQPIYRLPKETVSLSAAIEFWMLSKDHLLWRTIRKSWRYQLWSGSVCYPGIRRKPLHCPCSGLTWFQHGFRSEAEVAFSSLSRTNRLPKAAFAVSKRPRRQAHHSRPSRAGG